MKNLISFKDFIIKENLAKWHQEQWRKVNSDGSDGGECGSSKGNKKPKRCLPKSAFNNLSKSERASTAKKKARGEKNDKSNGKKPTFVKNTKKAKKAASNARK